MSQHGLCTDQPIASPGEWHFGVARTRAELGDIESARLASRMEALGMRPAGPSEKLIAALLDPVGGRWTDSLVNPDDSARQV